MNNTQNFDRYLQTVERARIRYRTSDGALIISVGARDSKYTRIEKMAASKYLGITTTTN